MMRFYPRSYPQTVVEVIDPRITYPPAALRAVRAFAATKPWSGSLEERISKFRQLNRDLSAAYDLPEPELAFEHLDGGSSGRSSYCPLQHRITLRGRLSVVTMLHEHHHARCGPDERSACRWSINLFKRCFPRQYARLAHDGHMLVRPVNLEKHT